MNTLNKTPIQADVHAKGLVSNLFGAFLDKLGEVLLGDFKNTFPEFKDDYVVKDVELKSGQTPFKKEKIDNRDLILYSDYVSQEQENGTWNTENNPDDKNVVDSDKTDQMVISNEGQQMSPKDNADVPDFTITWAPVASKGYEGFSIAIATYSVDGHTYEKQGVFKQGEFKAWLADLKKDWKIPDTVTPQISEDESATAASKLTVTLQKVIGSDFYDIALTRINANYDLNQVCTDLDSILSEDTFVNSIPDQETTYVIIPDESGSLCIEQSAPQTTTAEIYQQLLNETEDMLDLLKLARWGAKGAIRTEFVSALESMRYNFEEISDKLSEWIVIDSQKLPLIMHSNESFKLDDLTAVEMIKFVQDKVNQYLVNLDLIYVNLSSEQQAYLDNCKNALKSINDYVLGRISLQ